MSENVEILKASFEAFNRAGPQALLEYAHPDVEIYTEPALPNAGTYYGHEEFMSWSAEWLEAWEEFRNEPQEFIEVGDSVVVILLRQIAIGKGSGISIEGDLVYVVEMRDGKASRLHLYVDKERALEVAEDLTRNEDDG